MNDDCMNQEKDIQDGKEGRKVGGQEMSRRPSDVVGH